MHNRGQLFASDFLIAMTIVILGFGIIASISEFNLYQNKEQTNYKELQEKAEAAAITLTNSTWSTCAFGTSEAAYSINTDKVGLIATADALKKRLGIADYNVQITLTEHIIKTDISPANFPKTAINSKNIVAIDLNVMWCKNGAKFSDINACMTQQLFDCTDQNIGKGTLSIKVGK